ncbi:hypothetical protein PRIC2_004226 [Phytophthora ramorum]
MVRVTSCRFVRLSCSEEDHPLFRRYYTRSNRERGIKQILRCFPHCCPEHAQRGYCGCSVHIMVKFDSDVSLADQQNLVVCARFEPSRVTLQKTTGESYVLGDHISGDIHEQRLQPGEVVCLPASLLAKSQQEQSVWIRADDVKQKVLPKSAVLFVLNNHRFPKWQYSYDSSVAQIQREMTHHLVAYVLYLAGSGSMLGEADAIVLARQESPGFSLISHRRSGYNSNNAECELPVCELARDGQFAALSFDPTEVIDETSPGKMNQQYEQHFHRDNRTARAGVGVHRTDTQDDTYSVETDLGATAERASREGVNWRQRQLDAQVCDFREKGQYLLILWKFVQHISLSDIGWAAELVTRYFVRTGYALQTPSAACFDPRSTWKP